MEVDMRTWMKILSEHYESFRARYPEEKLLIVFDIDGTIIDMRYIICHALKSFDALNGTNYFTAVGWKEIDFHEEQIDCIFERHNIPQIHCEALRNQFWDLLLSAATAIEAHRPFQGVLDVIRWFQLQTNTFVGLNTGRPESLRRDTLDSLNKLGSRFNVRFFDDLLFMRPDDWKHGIPAMKSEGIRHFQEKGYQVFAFVDNEPENLQTVSDMDPDRQILLLHADTIFKSTHTVVPERAVKGRDYNVGDLTSDKPLPRHIQLVWQCSYNRKSFAAFIGSNIHWLEIDLGSALKSKYKDDQGLSLFECLDFAAAGEKCVKFDVGKSILVYERALETAAAYGFTGKNLWFKLDDAHVLRGHYLARLKEIYPEAIVEYDINFLARSVLDEPSAAREILLLLKKAGVARFSLKRGKPAWRRIASDVATWGFDVHIDSIASFENFLQTALLTPRSMTLNFGFSGWSYFGSGSEENNSSDSLLKLTA